jgi:hypothetical protein
MRISFDPKILCITFDTEPPIVPDGYGYARSSRISRFSICDPMPSRILLKFQALFHNPYLHHEAVIDRSF